MKQNFIRALLLIVVIASATVTYAQKASIPKDKNAAIIRKLYEAVNEKNLDYIKSLGTVTSEWFDVPFNYTSKGSDAIIDPWKSWFEIFPDATCEVRSLVSMGEYVTAQGIGRGTQKGVFQSPAGTLQPSGVAIAINFCDVYRLKDGKIIRADSYFDFYSLFKQLTSGQKITKNLIMKKSNRYKAGWEKLNEIDGEAGEQVINSLKDISPELGDFIIEYAFGDIYTRTGLDLKSKEIATVAGLTAMGTAESQLKVHLNGALNTGSSINEVKEVILQMSVYSGFPSCINAMNALKEVLKERQAHGIKDTVGNLPSNASPENRLQVGEQELTQLDSSQVDKLKKAYSEFSPALVKLMLEFGYADIFSRDNLDKKHRQIATIAALTALRNAQSQLKFHINAGLNIGLSVENIKEIMLLMTVYSGFPSAINGTNILKEVVAERANLK